MCMWVLSVSIGNMTPGLHVIDTSDIEIEIWIKVPYVVQLHTMHALCGDYL